MAWLIVFVSILAVVVFLAAMYFGFKNVALQEVDNNTEAREIDLDKLSTMVANKIIYELRKKETDEVSKVTFQSDFQIEKNKVKETSNIIDFNSRIEGLKNVGNW